MAQSMSYLLDLVARQRASPGEGLLGALIREYGDAIDDRELAGLADGVFTGGLETTASMLALERTRDLAAPGIGQASRRRRRDQPLRRGTAPLPDRGASGVSQIRQP
jgi:hypothetical protein